MLKKNFFGQIAKNYLSFYPKNWHQALKNMGFGSEIRDPDKPIPDPGSRGQKGTGSRIRIRNTGKKYSITIKKYFR